MRRTVTSATRNSLIRGFAVGTVAVMMMVGAGTPAFAIDDVVDQTATTSESEATPATDTPAIQNPHGAEKVFVCKYVGTPGVDERLQTGDNPISVSVNAIQNNRWDGNVPGWFSDAHDRSYVLAYDTGQPEPSVSECPEGDTPDEPPTTPEPTVVYTDWVDGTFVCGDGEMIQTRAKTTTTYSWEKVDGEWVLIETVNTVLETGFRPLTDAEIESCKPEIPAPAITVTTVDGEWTCDDTEIPVTVTTTTTPWVAVLIQGSTWELQPGTPVTETETQTRALTPEEIEVCETDPPAVSTPNPPQFVDFCGTENDESQIPTDTHDWTYQVIPDGSVVTVVATGVGNVRTPEGASTLTWVFEFDDTPCEDNPPVENPPVVHTPPAVQNPPMAHTPPVIHKPTPIYAPAPVRTPPPMALTGVSVEEPVDDGIIMMALVGLLLVSGSAAGAVWHFRRTRSAS